MVCPVDYWLTWIVFRLLPSGQPPSFAFLRTARVFSGDRAMPPNRPSATADGFLTLSPPRSIHDGTALRAMDRAP